MRNRLNLRLLGIAGTLALLLAGVAVAGVPANGSAPGVVPVGAAGDTTPAAASTGRCLQIAVPAQDYETYREILNPNDLLLVTAARVPERDSGEFFFSEARYESLKSMLKALQDVPVRKGIIFSSYEDLENKIDDISPYVDLVAYNSEFALTPDEELDQMEDFVKRFAQLAKSRGLAVGWGPTSERLRVEPELLELASEVDRIGLQHQNVPARLGVEATVSLTQQRSQQIRELNPNIEISLQLKGDLEAIEDVLRQTIDDVDMVLILTKHGVPFDYQQLFDDVDLRSGCTGQPLLAAPTVPPTQASKAAPSPTPSQTPVPSPTPEPSGGIPIPCCGGIGSALLLLLVLWGWTAIRK